MAGDTFRHGTQKVYLIVYESVGRRTCTARLLNAPPYLRLLQRISRNLQCELLPTHNRPT